MTLNPVCENVETAQGVPLTVTGVAQVKIMKNPELLHTASEQFLGKKEHEIKSTVLQTLEGHLRAILGTLTVEEVYKDRDQFASLVREAECEKAAMDIKYSTDTKIEDNIRGFKLQKANFDMEVNTAKAEAQLAYELQAAKIQQRIRQEEIQIQVVERRKQIEIEEQEIKRKEKELIATVKLPAEAEGYKVQTIAEGQRTKTVEAARADGEKIRLIGAAEARATEAVGRAEAERMRMKASAYKQYGDAAILSLVLEALPQIAAEVSAPLAKTDQIVLIGGGNNTTHEVNKLMGTLPPAIQALTGVDLTGALGKIPGATMAK